MASFKPAYLPQIGWNSASTNSQYWRVENSLLHWCINVVFGDDQMRARTGHAAHNLAVLRHFALNLIRLAPVKRKGGLKVRRLIAATFDAYRAELLGLTYRSCDCPGVMALTLLLHCNIVYNA